LVRWLLRAGMILVGAWLITQFHWVLYLFGAFLVFHGREDVVGRGFRSRTSKQPGTQAVWRQRLRISPSFRRRSASRRRSMASDTSHRCFVVIVPDRQSSTSIFAVDSIPAIFRHHEPTRSLC